MVAIAEGQIIAGKYQLERPLARGGMGSVWIVRHRQLDALMAAKFMDTSLVSSAVARGRFEREARAAAQLRSVHVVQVHDYGVEDGTPYLIMELLQGEDLGARIRRVGRLSPPAVAEILVQASRALRRAHEAGIVHRDLKPGNVFIAHNDDAEVVKVLDFGIAKAAHLVPAASGEEATKTGQLLGSPHYMSPEQARRSSDADHRTDLWALAAIAYRALTGEYPFPGDEIYELIMSICTDPLVPPSRHVPELGPEIDRFFERAFTKAPAGRFQSAPELAGAFAKAAGLKITPSELSQSTPGMIVPAFAALPGAAPAAPSAPAGGHDGAAPEAPAPPSANRTVAMPHRDAATRPEPSAPAAAGDAAGPTRAEDGTPARTPLLAGTLDEGASGKTADLLRAEGTLTQAPSAREPRPRRGLLGVAGVAIVGIGLGAITAVRVLAPAPGSAAHEGRDRAGAGQGSASFPPLAAPPSTTAETPPPAASSAVPNAAPGAPSASTPRIPPHGSAAAPGKPPGSARATPRPYDPLDHM